MIEIGKYNLLTPLRKVPPGLILGDDEEAEVLLPTKYIPEDYEIGEQMVVFVYRDNENRPISTTLQPKMQVGQFGGLRVREANTYGAFLDWGIAKDLLCPHREQESEMAEGRTYLVYLYLDDISGRLVTTSRLQRFLDKDTSSLQPDEEVKLMAWKKTDLGMKFIINQRFEGLAYNNEMFRNLKPGDEVIGFVKGVREDGKVDVMVEKPGYERIEPNAGRIVEALRANAGFLPLTDKSGPDEIRKRLEMSKKTFKKAIGALYKARLITLSEDGIFWSGKEE
ncbi:MAG TPA: GntR family transcriptional regulator [Bacteroidetes bacterium]|nr:GntR family transcriptional regulator [Bacteroidota bacterium]